MIETVLSLNDSAATPLVALTEIGIGLPTYYATVYEKPSNPGMGRQIKGFIVNRYPQVIIAKKIRSPTDLLIANIPRCTTIQYTEALLPHEIAYTRQMLDIIKQVKPRYYVIICHARAGVLLKNEIRRTIKAPYEITIDACHWKPIHYKRIYWTNFAIDRNLPQSSARLQNFLESGHTDREIALTISSTYHKGISAERYYHYGQRQIVFEDDKQDISVQIDKIKYGLRPGNRFQTNQKIRKLYPSEIEKLMALPTGYLNTGSLTSAYKIAAACNHVDVLKHIFKSILLKKIV